MQLPGHRPERSLFGRVITIATTVALLSGLFLVPLLTALTAEPAAAAANAVVPDSAITGFTPATQFAGNDDGTYPCGGSGNASPPCTDSEVGPTTVPLGFSINLYGTEYSGAYINNNGNITFDNPLPNFTAFGLAGTSSVVIAPFFADIDTRVGNTVEFGTGTLNGHRVFVVNWPGVGCFDQNDTVTDNFQLILIDRPDRATGRLGDDFDIEFNYDSIQWDASQANGGGPLCTNAAPSNSTNSAVVGFSNGTSTTADTFQLPGSQTSGAFLDSNASTGLIHDDLNSTVPGRYIFGVTAGSPQTTVAPTALAVKAATGDHGDATMVSAVLTNSDTSAPVGGQPVVFTLNGAETCTATTDGTGTASCQLTPKEAAGTYTLSASFVGDSDFLASSGSADFVVTHEETALSYTGATSAVNGQSVTLSGVLSTDDPVAGTGVAGKTVTFTLGGGSTAQTCTGTTGATGVASCVITTVEQAPGAVAVAASFAGDAFYQPASSPATTVTVTAPTALAVKAATGDHGDATMVSAVLTNAVSAAPVGGKPVVFTLNGIETCTGTTDGAGTASCSLTPGEAAGTYTLSASFVGDSDFLASSGSADFVVTHEETALSYTGATSAVNGQSVTLSGVLSTDDPAGAGVAGRTVTFTLGGGSTAQTCTGTTVRRGRRAAWSSPSSRRRGRWRWRPASPVTPSTSRPARRRRRSR